MSTIRNIIFMVLVISSFIFLLLFEPKIVCVKEKKILSERGIYGDKFDVYLCEEYQEIKK